jgi:hypothetical protein
MVKTRAPLREPLLNNDIGLLLARKHIKVLIIALTKLRSLPYMLVKTIITQQNSPIVGGNFKCLK